MNSLTKAISDALSARSAISDVESMIQGDHWLEGRGWVGPKYREGTDGSETALTEIERQFVSKNTLNEVAKRHRDSVVSKPPSWSLTVDRFLGPDEEPTQEEQSTISEAEQLLTLWLSREDVHREVQDAVKTLLYARVDGRRSVGSLRLYLPEVELDEDGELPNDLSPEDLIQKIRIRHHSPTKCGVVVDEHGNDIAAFYRYVDEDTELQHTEITVLGRYLRRYDPAFAEKVDEALSGPAFEPSDTLVILLNNADQVQDAVAYPLGERLLVYEMSREPLISPSAISLQKLQNLALTMMSNNVVLGGFLERTVLNGQRPGVYVDSSGKQVDPSDDNAVFMPMPMNVGAGATNFLMGEPIYDNATGEITGYTTPNIVYREPVPVDTFRDSADEAKKGIYEETVQLHVLISGDAASSGTSRRQAANDFVSSLGTTAAETQGAYRWMLETVLAWHGFLSGSEGKFEDLKAVVQPKLTAVQPTSEELKLEIELYNAGIQSQETTMANVGIEDTEAEVRKIDAERERQMEAFGTPVPGELDPRDDEGAEDDEPDDDDGAAGDDGEEGDEETPDQ